MKIIDIQGQDILQAGTVKAPDVAGTNIAGSDLTVAAGKGTGNGFGGFLRFQTAPPGSSGTIPGTPVTRMVISDTGCMGLGVSAPTACLHVAAGQSSASGAPLKLNAGNLLSTTEAGAVEFASATDRLHFTTAAGAGTSTGRKTISFAEDFVGMDPSARVFLSRLPNVATAITLVSGTAYFVYVGRTTQALTVKHVEFFVNTNGTGGQTAEVGLFSSSNAPNKGNQSLTKLSSTGTVDSLTTNGIKRNTSSFAYSVAAGTHLWAGIRTAMATTQPALAGLCMDYSQGLVLSTASAGALTGAGPWTGSIIAVGSYLNTAIAPDLRVTLD
jgi:hypothetical protein